MAKIRIGCAGWSYKDWSGPFYPKSLSSKEYLGFYSKYFDIVEVNSTFYNLPTISTLKNWLKATPNEFRFSIKVWQNITHKKIYDLNDVISDFFNRIDILESKVEYFLFQFPPWFHATDKNVDFLKKILNKVKTSKKISLEFRNNSWFDHKILTKVISGNVILGTAYLKGVKPFYWLNQKSYYIRAIGDRELTIFNKTQRNLKDISDNMLEFLQKYKNSKDIADIFIIFNNHFNGFSPTDSIELKRKLGLKYKDFRHQKNLMDYF